MIDTASIERAVRSPGGHLQIGRGGCILHYDGVRLSCSDADREDLKQAAIEAGLPVIDSRTVPFDIALRLAVHGPMIAERRLLDLGSWHDLIVVPLAALSTVYRQVGADVHNIADDPDTAAWFAARQFTSLERLVDEWLRHALGQAAVVSIAADRVIR